MAISTYIADAWSATDYGDSELAEYARMQLCGDTRLGIQSMAGLSLIMQLSVAVLVIFLGLDPIFLSTNLLFGLLSLHVLISAAYLNDVRTLHALGMAFLVIGALCLTILAHRAGELDIGVMAATVMLFVAIPLVPWALRETIIVIGVTYVLLTSSLVAVPDRFTIESLWVLQLLILGAALIVIVVTARNTSVRKQDLRARFELENTQSEMELLLMQDHLTGAWNRRYLDDKFPEFAERCRKEEKSMHVAILDIDDFKGINDMFGHDVGDKILISVADTFVRHLGKNGRLIRLGGDEFQIIYCGDDLDVLIEFAIAELQQNAIAHQLVGERTITLSAGIATCENGETADAESLYRAADRALYAAKEDMAPVQVASDTLTRTGSWQL